MKAVHVSWGAFLVALAILITQAGHAILGQPVDWTAIGGSITAIVACFTPAAQLRLPAFIAGLHQGNMPRLK